MNTKNILVDGYFDRNFGDDMMIRIIAHQLSDCRLYIKEAKKELLLPFINSKNIFDWFENQNIKIDLVLRIVGSGFIITGRSGMVYCILNILKSKIFKQKKLPSAVIGFNVGPFVNSFAKRLSIFDMNQYNLFTVRDSFSYNFVKGHIKNKPLFCFPDILFSIPDGWLPANTGEGCLGISAYRMQHRNNLYYYEKIAQIAQDYIKKNNKKVLLFSFNIENENDLAAAYTIKGLCNNGEMVEVIAHNDDGSHIINNMARCSQIIGIRLHSCLLAMKMGIPLIPIFYSKKTDYVLNDLNY